MKLATEKKLTFFCFLGLPVVLFAIFIVYPILWTFFLSFRAWDGISPNSVFIGLENYRTIFRTDSFYIALFNNLRWLIFSLTLPPGLGLFLALLIDRKIKQESFFQVVFFLPYAVTPVAVASVWSWLYLPRGGFFNQLLILAGLGHLRQVWLGDPNIASYSVMFANLWWNTGFSMVIFFAGLRAIPSELLEAADIDGASFRNKLQRVILPQLLPSTVVVMGMAGIGAMRIFDLIYASTRGGPAHSTHVLATLMYHYALQLFNMGFASGIAIILLILAAIVILPYIYYNAGKLDDIT